MGKGALAPCPPSTSDDYPEWWARFRFAHPTIPVVVIASASEAIHRATKQVWIASSLSLLAMTLMEFPDSNFKQLPTRLRVLAARRARSFARTLSLEKRGSRECRVRAAPAVSCAKVHGRKRTRAYRFSGNTPAFPAQWFYGLCRALVSAKSARMCERAVLTNRPSLDLSPFVLEGQEPDGERGTDPVSSSTRTVAWA